MSIEQTWVRLSVKVESEDVLLKGRLPRKAASPRALAELLDTLARWSGEPVRCVLSATGWARPLYDARSFGRDFVLSASPLVLWVFAVRGSRQLVLGDLGETGQERSDGEGVSRATGGIQAERARGRAIARARRKRSLAVQASAAGPAAERLPGLWESRDGEEADHGRPGGAP